MVEGWECNSTKTSRSICWDPALLTMKCHVEPGSTTKFIVEFTKDLNETNLSFINIGPMIESGISITGIVKNEYDATGQITKSNYEVSSISNYES